MKTEKKQKRRKVRRKVFSLLLAVVLTVTGIDLSLFTTTVMANVIGNRPYGKDIIWSYDEETNVLSISGTGDMKDFPYNTLTDFQLLDITSKEGITVEITEGVTSIGAYALQGLKMETIQIPESVTRIGDGAFYNCSKLTTVAIPANVTTIGEMAFRNCRKLANIEFKGAPESLGNDAFGSCSALTSVDLTDVKSIGEHAFNSAGLTEVILTGVKSIGYEAFYKCNYLRTVDLTGVESMRMGAFAQCGRLGSVTISDSLKIIPPEAFRSSGLTSVTIPDGVTEIGLNAFSACESLKNVTISDSVATIGENAFSSCESLINVKLPNTLESIPKGMFSYCSALKTVEIPETVTRIEELAFSRSGLTSVTIPSNVTWIHSAFSNCASLGEVIAEGEEPARLADGFQVSGVFNGCKFVKENTEGITVPEGAIVAYLTGWKDWSAYIKDKGKGVTQVIETVFEEYTATKDTTEEEIKKEVEQKLTEVGIGNATVTVEDFQKTDTNVSGTVNVTIGDGENAEKITIPFDMEIRKLLTDEEKVSAVKDAVEGVLRDYTATNNTTKEEIESAIAKALETVKGIDGTSVAVEITKQNALQNAAGYVRGTVTITSNSQTDTVAIDKEIARLVSLEGMGTAEEPYQVNDKEALEKLRDLVNGGEDFTGAHFQITADIDLGGSGEDPWTPIGTGENPFKGTLDGNGHTVSGLHINDGTKDDQGLFGVNAGTIENLTVEGSVTGKDNVGGIAGTNTESGVIKGCTSSVTVTGENNVGGIAGKNDGTIIDCTNNGTVTGTGNNVGGVTGNNTGTVNGSDNTGTVNGNDNVGGIAGNNTGTVNGSDNTGTVNGNDNVGGIAGSNTGTVSGGDNTGTVNGNDNVGGITGTNTGKVEDSVNGGTVTGTGTGAGGIAGTNNGSLDNDTNTAPVTGKDDVGGITGTNGENGTVEGCTNSGNVTVSGDGDSTPGAIIGNNQNQNPDAVKDDYYQKTDTVNKDLTGIGEGTGAGRDPAGITSGQTPTNPGGNPAETDKAAAKAFEDEKIAAIERATPVGGAAWKQAVKDAVEAFGRLTAGQKELVSANAKKILSDAQAVLAAVEKIEAIGTVVNTAECGQKIKAARDAYNKLTSDQKAKIPESMKKILTDAERAYAALQNGSQNGGENLTQEEKKQIQEIAKELGVSEETAAKIQAVAKELGVSVDTILLNDDTILKQKSENDVKGSTFARLKAKASKVTKTSVKLTWKKVKGADGYLVYGTKCGIKNTYKLLKTVKKNGTSYTQKKLKKGGQYKYIVRAYKLVDGKKITIAASKTVHAHTAGGKYGNPKSVTVNKTRAYLVKGKSLKVKAAVAKTSKKLKRHRSVWVFFESSNTKVATVTKKGEIKAKAKGTCTIYVYAQNGVYKEIKVTVAGKAKKSTSIKLNKKKYSMKKGASYTLKPTVKPATSTDTVKWTSSNKKVAAVDAYGTVKAKKKGTATITAKTTSGKKATCKITVK